MKLLVLKCPECRADIEIEEGRTSFYCQYCGCKILLDDEKKETTINKNINITKNTTHTKRYVDEAEVIRETNKAKENKRGWIALIVCAVIAIGIPFGMLFKFDIEENIAKSNGKINAGFYRDLIGENYETVEAHFESAGFTNVELIDLNDSGITFWNEGKVETISVGGNTSFDSTDWFAPDTKVVISYH